MSRRTQIRAALLIGFVILSVTLLYRNTLPDNGSAYLAAPIGSGLTIESAIRNKTFDILSIDLAEYSTLFAEPLVVPFIGYKSDGSIVRTNFITDGIIDGAGPLNDFETFYFGSEFHNLLSLDIPESLWSLDNVVLSVVPEPQIISFLFFAAVVGLCRRRACRKGYCLND